jgi:hypothetical protein
MFALNVAYILPTKNTQFIPREKWTYNVILRRFRENIFAVEKQKVLNMMRMRARVCVCVCGFGFQLTKHLRSV